MIDRFNIHVFYPDGGPPETGLQTTGDLSDRWLSVCRDLLDAEGPLLDRSMGSTLSHFHIQMAGPTGDLAAYGHTCFNFAITMGTSADQDVATSGHFRHTLNTVARLTGAVVSDAAVATISSAQSHASFLMLDRCVTDVDEDQKGALMQLGFHLAGAYYGYTSP